MIISIDDSAGFCWGVVKTIDKVEEVLQNSTDEQVYVLGDIIHNPREIERLEAKGLKTITHSQLQEIPKEKSKVIIRAHGEPPSTFKMADDLGLNVVDATCPLVQALQNRIKKAYDMGYQIVVYGKKDHAEVIGISGVCNGECIVVKSVEEALEKIDFSRKTMLFSQTTMEKQAFYEIKEALENKVKDFIDGGEINEVFIAKNTLCKYVYGREDKLQEFAANNDIVLFVAGKNSSNGKSLYHVCLQSNPKTYFIEDIDEINYEWLAGVEKVGITGATSTPQWYMEKVKEKLENKLSKELVEV
ncbi:MAG: 4-hydroxy-3-methylbut-2-enyl diphosphate reductase [Bacteroidetes bacterium]|nr:MAG: 4-hydroxy-3-methylbut-2-enyl diphosphate reductase [Bacteroidota bacterium]